MAFKNYQPVGYRFHPTDKELIDHYLRLKINGFEEKVSIIPEVDICNWEPSDLPGLSVIETNDDEWYFFSRNDRRYPNGGRVRRATKGGYWKATGNDRQIKSGKKEIGRKKILVFHSGRGSKAKRTGWKIHEYHATDRTVDSTHAAQGGFVLCRLKFKDDYEKRDKDTGNSDGDKVENIVCSPSVGKLFTGDTQSKSTTPLLGRQAETGTSRVGGCVTNNSERTNLDKPSYITDDKEDQGLDITSIQPDRILEQAPRGFCEVMMEPHTERTNLDNIWRIANNTDGRVLDMSSIKPELELENTLKSCHPIAKPHSERLFLDTRRVNANRIEDRVLDTTYFQQDQELGKAPRDFHEPVLKPPDAKIFSPLHLQLQFELGSSYLDFSNDCRRSQHQSAVQMLDINTSMMAFLKDSGSCSLTDFPVAQGQVHGSSVVPGYFRGGSDEENDEKKAPLQMESISEAYLTPDLTTNVAITEHSRNFNILQNRLDASSAPPADRQELYSVRRLEESYNNNGAVGGIDHSCTNAENIACSSRTPSFLCGPAQGTAPRRIRFHRKLQIGSVTLGRPKYSRCVEISNELTPTVTEVEKATETHTSAAAASTDENQDVSHIDAMVALEPSSKVDSNGNLPVEDHVEAVSMVSKAPPAQCLSSSSLYKPTVLLAVGLFGIYMGILGCLKS